MLAQYTLAKVEMLRKGGEILAGEKVNILDITSENGKEKNLKANLLPLDRVLVISAKNARAWVYAQDLGETK